MALRPSLKALVIAGKLDAPHTLDIFVDYVCPFSAKMALAIENVLKPKFAPNGEYGDSKVKVILRLQVQPWHSTSTLTHEVAIAVARISPENFWAFSLGLFKNQQQYFDIPTSTLTPLQIREKLAQLASEYLPSNKVDEFKELLSLKNSPNGGLAITDDLKYTIKFSRQNGIHVSPTVLWDGLIAGDISSGWGEAEWAKFLKENVV